MSEVESKPHGSVHKVREDDLLIISVDNPPVNALSQHIRQSLLDAFEELAGDATVRTVILTGANGRFVAGADIRELDRPPSAPALREVLAAIDACPQTMIAAIDSAALGGGLELALACDWRIAGIGATLGLPEVRLGIIPGAGGTQRLPRLVGVAKAIDLIAGGRIISAQEGLALSVIDEVCEAATIDAARARAAVVTRRRVSTLPIPIDSFDAQAQAERDALRRGRGQPAVAAAVQAVQKAAASPFDEGMEFERDLFLRLRGSREAAAQRHLFFAERQAAKVRGIAAPPRPLRQVAVIGGGTMGSGIAVALVRAGLAVHLIERDQAALDAANLRLEKLGGSGARDAVVLSTDFGTIAQADLVIEAVFEDFAVKSELFTRLDAVARPGAVLATNTSFLNVDRLARVTRRPQDVLGLHFFSPAHVMKLLEVVRGADTADDTLMTGLALARRIGKVPVVSDVCDGFIGNRISQAYRRQCEFMLEEGAWPEDVDAAMEAFGFAMGPFAVVDLAGLDISWARRKATAADRDARERYVGIADTLCEMGRFGQKTRAGWYRYAEGSRSRQPDEAVHRLIEAASRARGVQRHSLNAEQIQRRALAAMVNEAALVLEDGIAQRPSDIDVVFVNGYGFPRTRGGPMYWAARQPFDALQRDIDAVEAATGYGFRRVAALREVLESAHGPEPSAAP